LHLTFFVPTKKHKRRPKSSAAGLHSTERGSAGSFVTPKALPNLSPGLELATTLGQQPKKTN
jgi:hypothetical protein